MVRSRAILTVLLVPIAALVVVGCLYRGYFMGMLPSAAAELSAITLPSGFRIAVYAGDVPGARQMAVGPAGVVFVGSRSEGKVYALVDRDGDNRVDQVLVVASGLNSPSGIAFRDGALYVGAVNRILRFRDVARDLARPPKAEVASDAYPSDAHHGWKFIAFGPDGKLYVPVGAPCNVCAPPGPLHATITRLDLAGGRPEVVARGVRNSVGFDFDPATGDLWFTDNGRDWLGDDQPPDELNHLTKVGEHFGFPFCHGNGIRDPEHNAGRSCGEFTAPARELGPHVAAIGMRFYTGRMFPEKYRGGIFIAEHGSWNRSTPIGYRVSFVKIENGRATSYESFASGWLTGSTASGRPADVLVMPDGALLVSDDKAGRIYRITYAGNG
ncbi:MAG: sorbosone dehydrogenase [Candidatus Rokuibacteriota bacterium]|nr:MAG: sorbosone dehydrogenase [Candidatus Rokubacteria bacterium]PYO04086.1 MAG: sorbosone dehydrogenase [Candidatus Rokubacteria bacterium]